MPARRGVLRARYVSGRVTEKYLQFPKEEIKEVTDEMGTEIGCEMGEMRTAERVLLSAQVKEKSAVFIGKNWAAALVPVLI